MPVEDVFSITGRGTVATGRIVEMFCKDLPANPCRVVVTGVALSVDM